MKKKKIYIAFAILAAIFYAFNIPFSKLLLNEMGSVLLAGLLYFGAGLGIGILFLCNKKKIKKEELLEKKDLPYTILMIILDVAAPILLMIGLTKTNAGTASLLNNFEIVATTIIAFVFFKEFVSFKLWIAILLVTISSFFLCFDDLSSFTLNIGSIFILGATLCWGLENNCTRKLSHKNTFEVVMIKGLCCGITSIVIGLIIGNQVIHWISILFALLLGFVSYGLSIFFYIKAQSEIGAAKTSAFYAVNPFIATLLSLLIFHNEVIYWNYWVALGIMMIGTFFIIYDTLTMHHAHLHTHHITCIVNGKTYEKVITHTHDHVHHMSEKPHEHHHEDLEEEFKEEILKGESR